MLGPFPRRRVGCASPLRPQHHRPSPSPYGSAHRKTPLSDFRAGGIAELQSCAHVQASRFAATQVAPTAVPIHGAAVAFTSEQNTGRYLPGHRICSPSEWVIDGRRTSTSLDPQPCRPLQGLSPKGRSLTRGKSRSSTQPSRECPTASVSDRGSAGALVTWSRQPSRCRRAARAGSLRSTPVMTERTCPAVRVGRGRPPHPRPLSRVTVVSCRSHLPGSKPATSYRSSTAATAVCQAAASRMGRLPRPGAGGNARHAASAAPRCFSRVASW
jgi:hypothetical protein